MTRARAVVGIHSFAHVAVDSLDQAADTAFQERERQMQGVNVVRRVTRHRMTRSGDVTAIAAVHHIGTGRVGQSRKNSLPVALGVEALVALAGLWQFVSGTRLPRARKAWLAVLSVLALAGTVAGMTVATAPPSAAAMAASSLVTLVLVGAWACWLGRRPALAPSDAGSAAAP